MATDDLPGELIVLTRDQHRERYLRSYHVRNPDADVGPGTQPYLDASAHADSCVPLYADARMVADATNDSTARGVWLEAKLAAAGLEPRLPAVGASGFFIASTATGGGTIYQDDELREPQSGLRFKCLVTALYTPTSNLVPIEGIDAGIETNLAAGTILEWTSPRPGIGPRGTVFEQADDTGLTGGHPEESDEEGQQRLVEAKKNPPACGNDAEYQRVIRQTKGIAVQQGFTIPCGRGPGTTVAMFLLRPSALGASRIPNGAQNAVVLANLMNSESADDVIFLAAIQENPIAMRFRVTWSRKAPAWADVTQWPPYAATAAVVDATTTPTPTTVRLHSVTTISDPVVGQTIAFLSRKTLRFVRKRISAITTIDAGNTWVLTFDATNQASDTTYTPLVGQAASPWSDSLQSLVAPIAKYFDGLGPGEQLASFPDPGRRGRRQPEAPESWPHTVTNRVTDDLFQLLVVNDIALASPSPPAAPPVGTPGTLSYLQTLGDLAVYKQ